MPRTAVTARSLAWGVLSRVLLQNRFASESLDQALETHSLSPKDRALATQLVYGVLREKGFLDDVLSAFVSAAKTPPRLQNLLRLGAYQIFFLDKVPPHAAVFESVELAKQKIGPSAAKMVNAVMRRLLEARSEKIQQRIQFLEAFGDGKLKVSAEERRRLAAALSLPLGLLERWLKVRPPREILGISEYFNSLPPLFFRVNPLRITPEKLTKELSEAGLNAELLPEWNALRLRGGGSAEIRPYLEVGLASVQDLGSLKVLEALAPAPGEAGLDACAGHGGKLSGIAERLSASDPLFAHEPVAEKREELEANFTRLGLKLPTWIASPAQAKARRFQFDWILIDAPCSGTGTLGRKPEIRWRLRPADFERHAKLQGEILEAWAPLLKPGGRLLYAVCSLEAEEGRQVLDAFLQKNPTWVLQADRTLSPATEGHDGFYWARVLKKQDLRP